MCVCYVMGVCAHKNYLGSKKEPAHQPVEQSHSLPQDEDEQEVWVECMSMYMFIRL